MRLETEVCVVGAGPAGSTFATRMAQLGHQVLLVERSPFPRPHVGEAMSPGVWDLLDLSQARSAVEALDVAHSTGARVRWIDHYEQLIDPPIGRLGFTVNRGEFDRALLETARAAGAAVLQPARVTSVERTASGWQIELSSHERTRTVRARFLADASGRSSRFRGRRIPTSPHTIALDGLWSFDHSENFQTHIEARREGWYWGAHLPGRTYRAMAFIDPDLLRQHQISKPGLDAFYRKLLSRTRILSALEAPHLKEPVMARDATCYFETTPIDSTSIKLGEAAFAIDPLSSSGVQKALQTALTGSVAINTILKGGDAAAAIDFYLDNHRRSVTQHAEWATSHYSEHRQNKGGSFWLRRARQPSSTDRQHSRANAKEYRGEPVRLAPKVRLVRVPCAVGDRVEMHEAFFHPAMARPIAFVNGIDVAPLVAGLATAAAGYSDFGSPWSPNEPHAAIISWLVRHGVLETASPSFQG